MAKIVEREGQIVSRTGLRTRIAGLKQLSDMPQDTLIKLDLGESSEVRRQIGVAWMDHCSRGVDKIEMYEAYAQPVLRVMSCMVLVPRPKAKCGTWPH